MDSHCIYEFKAHLTWTEDGEPDEIYSYMVMEVIQGSAME